MKIAELIKQLEKEGYDIDYVKDKHSHTKIRQVKTPSGQRLSFRGNEGTTYVRTITNQPLSYAQSSQRIKNVEKYIRGVGKNIRSKRSLTELERRQHQLNWAVKNLSPESKKKEVLRELKSVQALRRRRAKDYLATHPEEKEWDVGKVTKSKVMYRYEHEGFQATMEYLQGMRNYYKGLERDSALESFISMMDERTFHDSKLNDRYDRIINKLQSMRHYGVEHETVEKIKNVMYEFQQGVKGDREYIYNLETILGLSHPSETKEEEEELSFLENITKYMG